YLWEHQGEPISEYAIATEALGRNGDFDPKVDSTVRVQVARLRTKLKEFYETAGAEFPLRLSVPLGHHELRWTYHRPQKPWLSALNAIPRRVLWCIGLSQLALALALACVVLLFEVRSLRSAIPAPPAPMPRFWRSFVAAGKPTAIV